MGLVERFWLQQPTDGVGVPRGKKKAVLGKLTERVCG